MPTAPFPVNAQYTAVALRFRNPGYSLIADMVLPRTKVLTKEFKYRKRSTGEAYTIPDTAVGRRGRPSEVEFTDAETPAMAKDYGLDDSVPQDDIDQAAAAGAPDPVARAVEGVTDLIMLDRERRVANLVFANATYPAGNKATLSGTSQWSDFTNSNPISAILAAMDAMIVRPTVGVFGRATFTQLQQHPKVVAAVLGSANSVGLVTRERLAAALELREVIVGESWVNTAKKGQTVALGRCWGKHAALLHINPIADANNGLTFGFTGEFGSRIAGAMPDPHIGIRGGQRVRVAESVGEVISASELGYFFENAVA